MTKEDAVNAYQGQTFHHVREKNADGTPYRCRANGKCKTWKLSPDRFKLPVKHGYFGPCFYITELNAHLWTLEPAKND